MSCKTRHRRVNGDPGFEITIQIGNELDARRSLPSLPIGGVHDDARTFVEPLYRIVSESQPRRTL
jgi:hypothetical protein